MTTPDKNKRKKWTPGETVAFLESYLLRKEEFQHKRKKRFAYGNVLQDLIDRGVLDPSTSAAALEIKMHTLLRTYRAGKFKNNFRRLIPYLELIFGDKAADSSDSYEMCDEKTSSSEISYSKIGELSYHTLNLSGKPIKPLDDGKVENRLCAPETREFFSKSPIDIKSEIFSRSPSPRSPCRQTSPLLQTNQSTKTSEKEEMKSVAREPFYAQKLEMYERKLETRIQQKRDYYHAMLEDSEKRFRESEAAKMQRHRERMDFFKHLLSK